MVYLNKVTEGCVANVAAKLESMQPCRSVKDRYASTSVFDSLESLRMTAYFYRTLLWLAAIFRVLSRKLFRKYQRTDVAYLLFKKT